MLRVSMRTGLLPAVVEFPRHPHRVVLAEHQANRLVVRQVVLKAGHRAVQQVVLKADPAVR